ncbi:MAG: PIN domain-containing protein [Planctomycetaceae bacterium]|jgi:tRNA(fMet)-specific endonuclease VapC|nr:PIN domain-containing protein [Planctomycetaceae bacterium]
MNAFAFDSNTISFYMRNHGTVVKRIDVARSRGDRLVIPSIVYYEVKRGLLYARASHKIQAFDFFCQSLIIESIDKRIAESAARIYALLKQAGRIVEDADILIGAYCVENDYTLITNNTKHYKNIPRLLIEDRTL